MNRIRLDPHDARWLRRWLRSNLSCFAIGVVLLILVAPKRNLPMESSSARATESTESATELPPETELVLLNSRKLNPVAPEGWRRTRNGWEHTSTWPNYARSINVLIHHQLDLEPAWIRWLFERVRSIPPLMIAVMQLAAIAAIVNATRADSGRTNTR